MGLFLNLTKWFWRYLNFSAAKKGIFLDKGPYIDVHMEGGGGVLKFVVCLKILLFLNNRSIVYFADGRGRG